MTTEWDYREVCPDGSCIGVIGDDGTCKVCGRAAPNWGNERARGLVDDQTAEQSDVPGNDEPELDDDDDDDDEIAATPAEGGGDWDQRELCDNGACVGVIGDDGVCSVCGSKRA